MFARSPQLKASARMQSEFHIYLKTIVPLRIRKRYQTFRTIEEIFISIISVTHPDNTSLSLDTLFLSIAEITRLFERDWKGEGDLVRRIRNGTRAQILNEFEKVRQRLDFGSHKMFICIILSYGNVEGFRTMDEEMIEYQEIFSLLSGSNWLHFSEKPKFFFIDIQPMKLERTGLYGKN